jgi:hypothetical protein
MKTRGFCQGQNHLCLLLNERHRFNREIARGDAFSLKRGLSPFRGNGTKMGVKRDEIG